MSQPAPAVTLVVLGTLTALGWGHQPSPEPQGWGLSLGGCCCHEGLAASEGPGISQLDVCAMFNASPYKLQLCVTCIP